MGWFDLFKKKGRVKGFCPKCGSKKLDNNRVFIFCKDCDWNVLKKYCDIEFDDTFFKERIYFKIL